MQLLIGFLFVATIAGMFTTKWNWQSYVLALFAAVGVAGLYWVGEGFW
jgi:hypothetical protein